MNNIAILLAGGTGKRFGSFVPKQYLPVNGKMIIEYSLEALFSSTCIDGIITVADEYSRTAYLNKVCQHPKHLGFAAPGETRQLSIYNALVFIEEKNLRPENVFIHDAARPYLTDKMISDYIEAIKGHEGVLPVLPMKDTIYFSNDKKSIDSLLDRSCLFAGQAPEVFRFAAYLKANKRLLPDEIKLINGSTEPAFKAGMDVIMVEGNEKNFKITSKEDMERFEQCVRGF